MEHDKALTLPLVFTFAGTILGKGFAAEISLAGRLLACQEVEGVWLYGVKPGGLAVCGSTFATANVALRDTLTKLFIDLSGAAGNFAAFKMAIETFFHESDDETQSEWKEAVRRVREGSMNAPSGLPKVSAENAPFVTVVLKNMEQVTPADNLAAPQEAPMALAAAA